MKRTLPLNTLIRLMLLLFGVLRIINFFYVSFPLQVISCAIMLGIMLLSFGTVKKLTARVILAMFVIAIGLLIFSKASFRDWISALLKNGNLVMMLTMAPMLSLPFFYEDYQGELRTLAQVRMQNLMSFLILLTLSSHLLGVLVSIGAVIIVYDLLNPVGKLYRAEKEFVTTITRGYSSSGFWSPGWACVIVYSAFPDVKWIKIVPLAILFAILFNALSLVPLAVTMKRHPERYPRLTPPEGVSVNKKKIVTMLILFFGMIGTIIALDAVMNKDLMLVVAFSAILFPLIASTVQNKWPAYRRGMTNYYDKSLMKVPAQVALYAAAGMLGAAVNISGIGAEIPKLLPESFVTQPALMVAALTLLIVIPALVGIHPVATGTAMVTALQPAALGLTNYTFCLAIIFGWIMGVMISPFSSQSLILSGETGRSNFDISIRSNWLFCLAATVLFSILISLIGPLFG